MTIVHTCEIHAWAISLIVLCFFIRVARRILHLLHLPLISPNKIISQKKKQFTSRQLNLILKHFLSELNIILFVSRKSLLDSNYSGSFGFDKKNNIISNN